MRIRAMKSFRRLPLGHLLICCTAMEPGLGVLAFLTLLHSQEHRYLTDQSTTAELVNGLETETPAMVPNRATRWT